MSKLVPGKHIMSMSKTIMLLTCILCALCAKDAIAQNKKPLAIKPKSTPAILDSLRKEEEKKQDSVIYTSKHIRYTTLALLKEKTITVPIDTSLYNIENFNPQYQPLHPTVNLGNIGLDCRDMLFTPRKTIGFDAGFHTLDPYVLNQDSIHYYRARAAYAQLQWINGRYFQQLFKLIYTQNIKPHWNFGANFNRIGGTGFYQNQNPDHTNIALFTWYEGKRYNLVANLLLNLLNAAQNGSVINSNIFKTHKSTLDRRAEQVRLSAMGPEQSKETWQQRAAFFKQWYFIGKLDSIKGNPSMKILPSQCIAHTAMFSRNRYRFFRNEPDRYKAFPGVDRDTLTNDQTLVNNFHNELGYNFYVHENGLNFSEDKVKLNINIIHDLYWYEQMGYEAKLQNFGIKGSIGYRFDTWANIVATMHHIVGGHNKGDFFYEASSAWLLGKAPGSITLGAYLLNQSPEEIYQRVSYQYYRWDLSFKKIKTKSFFMQYKYPDSTFSARGDYFLISNYLYLKQVSAAGQVLPVQNLGQIHLIKVTMQKDFKLGKFHLDNFLVYQKSDFSSVLMIPELYIYSSFYYASNFFNKAINANIGFDVRFNTSFQAPSYAIDISQFYKGPAIEFPSYPIASVWVKANLRRASLFVKYDYANQGLSSEGYYTVNRYPMPSALFSFGVRWNFYN